MKNAASIHDLTIALYFIYDGLVFKAVRKTQNVVELLQKDNALGWKLIGDIRPSSKKSFVVIRHLGGLTWECKIRYGKAQCTGEKAPEELGQLG